MNLGILLCIIMLAVLAADAMFGAEEDPQDEDI